MLFLAGTGQHLWKLNGRAKNEKFFEWYKKIIETNGEELD